MKCIRALECMSTLVSKKIQIIITYKNNINCTYWLWGMNNTISLYDEYL